MIADLDETLRQLLIAEMPVRNGEVDIAFDQPRREWSSRLGRPTVNLFLYDVRENNVLRQHQWEQMANGRRMDNLAHLKRTPFRVDCFYMLTTWARDPGDEHRLLTRAMLALFRFPVLPADRLVGALRNQTFDIQPRLACHDRLTNPAEVWSALDNEMRPSVPYVVTLALDPWAEVAETTVSGFTLRSGQAAAPPAGEQLLEETRTERHWIGGTARSQADRRPVAGARVAVEGTDLWDVTDDQGRFTLGPLPAGEYTLVGGTAERPTARKRIVVPRVQLLFSAGLGPVDALSAGQVSAELQGLFAGHRRPLSAGAQVEVRHARQRWLIADAGERYLLNVERQALHVHALAEETCDLELAP